MNIPSARRQTPATADDTSVWIADLDRKLEQRPIADETVAYLQRARACAERGTCDCDYGRAHDRTWTIGNDGSGARIWFVLRNGEAMPFGDRYHVSAKTGNSIRYATWQNAQRVANRLNAAEGRAVDLAPGQRV